MRFIRFGLLNSVLLLTAIDIANAAGVCRRANPHLKCPRGTCPCSEFCGPCDQPCPMDKQASDIPVCRAKKH